MNILLILIGLGVLGVAYVFDGRRRRQALLNEPDRETLDEHEIYRMFYSNSKTSVTEITTLWNEVASALKVSPGKLRPYDKFGRDIGAGYITSEELDYLFQQGAKRAKSLGIAIDFESVETVDDYIKAFIIPQE